MELKTNLFGYIRKQALSMWETNTNRDCRSVNDDITGSFECKWQDRATQQLGYEHISIFCSLGEWANNISDILKDENFDYYDYLNDEDCQALFRYYTRLLLIVSEILCDFEDIIQKIGTPQSKNARNILSSSKGDLDSLLYYINRVCKHKVTGLHRCNHHLPIWFEDCAQSNPFVKPVSIRDLDFTQPDGILVPKLGRIIEIILYCYQQLDELFEKDSNKFKLICDEYNGFSYLG